MEPPPLLCAPPTPVTPGFSPTFGQSVSDFNMRKPRLLNAASIFHLLPFVILSLLLWIGNCSRMVLNLLPLASLTTRQCFPNNRFFSRKKQEPLPLSFLQFRVLSPPPFQFHRSPPVSPMCFCFCPSFCFTGITNWGSFSSGRAFPSSLRLSQIPVLACTNFWHFVPVSVLPQQLIKMVTRIFLLHRGRDGQGRLPDVSRENSKQGQLRSLGGEEACWGWLTTVYFYLDVKLRR